MTATGQVWAWGRNKQGQLGTGDMRDKVLPMTVAHEDDAGQPWLLGLPKPSGKSTDTRGTRIVCIAASANNSVAVAYDASVWQWGAISEDFTEGAAGTKGAKQATGGAVKRSRPHKVTEKDTYRSNMRKQPTSISDFGQAVLDDDAKANKEKIKDLMESVRMLKQSICMEHTTLVQRLVAERAEVEAKKKHGVTADQTSITHLEDTIQMLDRDINIIAEEIATCQKNVDTCTRQQEHTRKQIDALEKKSAKLNESIDNIAIKVLHAPKNSSEQKRLVEKQREIGDFVEANQNTRMTLLDQRTETDREKQKLIRQIEVKKTELLDKKKRLKTVKTLCDEALEEAGASDLLVSILKKLKNKISDHFEWCEGGPEDFIIATDTQEKDVEFLEDKLRECQAAMIAHGRFEQLKPFLVWSRSSHERPRMTISTTNREEMLADGTPEALVESLVKIKRQISDRFKTRDKTSQEFVVFMKGQEKDRLFLQQQAELSHEHMKAHGGRCEKIKPLVEDQLQLKRDVMALQDHQWSKQDLDLSVFFEGSPKPTEVPDEEPELASSS